VDDEISDVTSVPGDEQRDEPRLDWEAPRWRHDDEASQGDAELEYRFRNTPAPGQRGAIDDDRTIAGEKGASDGSS